MDANALEIAKQAAHTWGYLAAGIGAGLVILGGAYGIGRLAASSMDAIGRQPEAAGQVRTAMLIAAGLIEGVTFFALVICLILATLK
ncbi:MAG TPA: ATP synthase F0 subunit C [Bacteroidota bacterium]|nr:ATP synthase F0 subunit C [Bacteroidota bacterium]